VGDADPGTAVSAGAERRLLTDYLRVTDLD
jgi:hypothetical protein